MADGFASRLLECFLVDTSGYWACGPVASNSNREGGSDSTRPMASHDDHSSASSLHFGLLGLRPGG